MRSTFPRAKILTTIHEFTEAPLHWRLRQGLIAKILDGAIANTATDYIGIKKWARATLRSKLGPTLWYEDLVTHPEKDRLLKFRKTVREELAKKFSLYTDKKWLVHPGLITPGKGVESLKTALTGLHQDFHMILMGGFGPKSKDVTFAEKTVFEMKTLLKSRFCLVKNADDETFKKFLIAADLVLLPYDKGLSERRSSFLSAMSCGANVWTTLGPYSGPLGVPSTGAHTVPVELWKARDPNTMATLSKALQEDEAISVERRLKNLVWAGSHTWSQRLEDIVAFTRQL